VTASLCYSSLTRHFIKLGDFLKKTHGRLKTFTDKEPGHTHIHDRGDLIPAGRASLKIVSELYREEAKWVQFPAGAVLLGGVCIFSPWQRGFLPQSKAAQVN